MTKPTDSVSIFTEPAPRLVQSISCYVLVSVSVPVCAPQLPGHNEAIPLNLWTLRNVLLY